MTKKECTLEVDVRINLDHGSRSYDKFQTITGMNEHLEVIVTEANKYTT